MTVAAAGNQQALAPNSYLVPKAGEGHSLSSEDEIIKKTPMIGARVMADKVTKDIFTYAPKGLSGSVNSNFYEFLSLGIVPYVLGSLTMAAGFLLANKAYGRQDGAIANFKGSQFAAGVALYGVCKWLGGKLFNKGVEARTGIDMDMTYRKIVRELPDHPGDKNTTAIEYHKVFESVDFPRWDLLLKQGEKNGNRYEYHDKIAKKMGYDEPLNSPDQKTQPVIKEVITKAMGAKAISSYIWAATGVALASQKSFGNAFNFRDLGFTHKLKALPGRIFNAVKNGAVDLWKGAPDATKFTKHMGKALIIGAIGSTIIGVINATSNFKVKKETESNIDKNKNYTEA